MTQVPLPFLRDSGFYGDFLTSACNQSAYDRVMAEDWGYHILLLIGASGAGKSHLAQVWQSKFGDEVCDLASWNLADEEALFHACNRAFNEAGRLLLIAPDAPAQLPIVLSDLKSRLLAAPVARIDAPDDALLAQLLVKQLAARQLSLESAVVDYMLKRMARSYEALHDVVEQLDVLSLAQKRPITIALARQILG